MSDERLQFYEVAEIDANAQDLVVLVERYREALARISQMDYYRGPKMIEIAQRALIGEISYGTNTKTSI